MLKSATIAGALLLAPVMGHTTTIIVEGGGPYNVLSDTLFSGAVIAATSGPGTYTLDFFTPGQATLAVADAAVTSATVTTIFQNLTMSWLDGANLNTLVQAAGIDTLTTTFGAPFLAQKLQFAWTGAVQAASFGFDVTTSQITDPGGTVVPLPAGLVLLASALGGAVWVGRRRQS